MLEDCLIESRPDARTRKPLTTVLSAVLHVVIALGLLLIPLFQAQVLPETQIATRLAPPPLQRALPDLDPPDTPAVQPYIVPDLGALIAPQSIPSKLVPVFDESVPAPTSVVSPRGVPGISSLLNGVAESLADASPLPLPPPAAVAVQIPAAPLRLGGNVQQANLIRQVKPAYPPTARAARIQGVVVLEATITKEGNVDSLRVVSGHLLLVQAAVDAVKQWQYRPTLLNGEPVEVITTITVSFSFQ